MSDNVTTSGLDGQHEVQAHLVATLQVLQRLENQRGAAVHGWGSRVAHLIQLALREVSDGEAEPEQPAPNAEHAAVQPGPLPNFAAVLREKRAGSGLTQEQLARRAGISKRTLYSVESGTQAPSRSTLVRLLAVPELRLAVTDFSSDVNADPAWAPNCWWAQGYNPSQLMQDMANLLNGPGGQLEQTHLYIEPQSANDYMALCSSAPVYVGFRNASPLEQIAAAIVKRCAGVGLDVAGLGSGDGQSEVRLTEAIVRGRAAAPDLRLYLLDISHTMLNVAYKHAKIALTAPGIQVYGLHANFHELGRYPILRADGAKGRRRLYTLLGGTMANLDNEVRFFQELRSCAATDDLCVLDLQLAYAPVEKPDEIRRRDPPLTAQGNPPHHKWLTGLLERHCQGAASAELEVDLTTHCPVPGSYEIDFLGHVRMRDGLERRFLVHRVKRYDSERLAACLDELGWECLSLLKYGVGTQKTAAVMLLRRR